MTASDLTKAKCVPCEGGVDPIGLEEAEEYLKQLKLKWELVDGKKIKHLFEFKNFREAINFVDKVADVAEAEGHHPDIYIFYNKVTIELWTHAINGLFKNDFILAAKIEKLVTL